MGSAANGHWLWCELDSQLVTFLITAVDFLLIHCGTSLWLRAPWLYFLTV